MIHESESLRRILRQTASALAVGVFAPVSARLGHSDAYFTAKTYIVTRTERQKVAAEAAEQRLSKFHSGTVG